MEGDQERFQFSKSGTFVSTIYYIIDTYLSWKEYTPSIHVIWVESILYGHSWAISQLERSELSWAF